MVQFSVYWLQCPTVSNVQSSTVPFDAPTPMGYPGPSNVQILYEYRVNGITISFIPRPVGSQYQETFPSGAFVTVTATLLDINGNNASCEFSFATPRGNIVKHFAVITF